MARKEGANTYLFYFYKTVLLLKLEITTLKKDISIRKSERDRLIEQSGPSEVHGKDYSEEIRIHQENGDDIIMNRLVRLSFEIPNLEYALKEKKREYEDIRQEGKKIESKLNDRMLTVFLMSAYEGKCNREIAESLGVSENWISQIKGKLNKLCDEMGF